MKTDLYLEILPRGKRRFVRVKKKRKLLRNPFAKTEPINLGITLKRKKRRY